MILSKYKIIVCTIILAIILALLNVGCSKTNGTYYSYSNKDAVYEGTTIDFLRSQVGYDSMLNVLNIVGLTDTLRTSHFTVFAFDNDAFSSAINNLNQLRMSTNRPVLHLATLDSTSLDSLVCRYILPGEITTDSLAAYPGGGLFPIIRYPSYDMDLLYQKEDAQGYYGGGPQFFMVYDTKGVKTQSFWVGSKTRSVNIKTSNGVVHLLASGHEFGFSSASKVLNK